MGALLFGFVLGVVFWCEVSLETEMKYSEMLAILQAATPEELAQDMTVYTELDEFVPVTGVMVSGQEERTMLRRCSKHPADGILDDGHLYLEIGG